MWSRLSKTRVTSATPKARRLLVPEKIISSILLPRRYLALCSPNTQRTASDILLLPEPLGPTTAVMPAPNSRAVRSAKDLNPKAVTDFKNKLNHLYTGQEKTLQNRTRLRFHGLIRLWLRNSGLRPSDNLAITANFISWNNAIIPDVLLQSFSDYKFYLHFFNEQALAPSGRTLRLFKGSRPFLST